MDRFTISLDDRLAQQFDEWMGECSYADRSEGVRDILRAELGKSKLRGSAGKQCVACLSYVFNHHKRDLPERLTSMQHDVCHFAAPGYRRSTARWRAFVQRTATRPTCGKATVSRSRTTKKKNSFLCKTKLFLPTYRVQTTTQRTRLRPS